MNLQDLKSCQLYIINGIIVDFFDSGVHPSKEQIMDAWKAMHGNENRMFTYADINWIISKVAKFYN